MEYLITYGWAFLVILIAIGALAYFGVLNPSRWVPDKCDFGNQLECVDYEVDMSDDNVNLLLRNNFGKSIEITNATIRLDTGEEVGSLAPIGGAAQLTPGADQSYTVHMDASVPVFAGEKQQFIIRIEFERFGSGNPHWLTGVLYTTVKE